MLIDPAGYFNGDRFDRMSDEARLYWPSFWCASNSLGRLELSYLKIRSEAFGRFVKPPSEEKIWELIGEYQRAYLLFIYEHEGQIWGQWDTSAKYLPNYQLAADKRTPEPPLELFNSWRQEYIDSKKKSTVRKFIVINNSKNVLETSESFKTSPHTRGVGVGVGVGEGDGIGEEQNHCSAEAEREPESNTVIPFQKSPAAMLLEQQTRWFGIFWQDYWRKDGGKKAAWLKFCAKVRSEEQFHRVMAAVMAQTPAMLSREVEHRPHATTWLNQERWEDEHSPGKVGGERESSSERLLRKMAENIQETGRAW